MSGLLLTDTKARRGPGVRPWVTFSVPPEFVLAAGILLVFVLMALANQGKVGAEFGCTVEYENGRMVVEDDLGDRYEYGTAPAPDGSRIPCP